MLREFGGKCRTIRTAAASSGASAPTSSVRAGTPPADAPTTIRRGRPISAEVLTPPFYPARPTGTPVASLAPRAGKSGVMPFETTPDESTSSLPARIALLSGTPDPLVVSAQQALAGHGMEVTLLE